MDRHVLWLRRFLLSRIVARVMVEGAVVGVVTGGAVAWLTDLGLLVAALLAVAAAQVFAVARVAAAVVMNPINHRFLMQWDDTGHLLQPFEAAEVEDPETDSVLTDAGFEFVIGLRRSDTDSSFRIYNAPSKAVLVAAGAGGEPSIVLSRLTDRRLVVTSAELVPPHRAVIVNQAADTSVIDLVTSHVDALAKLRDNDLTIAEIGPESILDQLHYEWDAWFQLGPFIGPFLAASTQRQPMVLQARVPTETLWERTAAPLAPSYITPEGPTSEQTEIRPLEIGG